MSLHLTQKLLTWFLAVTLVLSVAFVVLYAARSPWRRTAMGWHLMTFMALFSWLLLLPFVNLVTGPGFPQWLRWTYVVSYALLPLTVGWRLWLLLYAQWRGRHMASTPPGTPPPSPPPRQPSNPGHPAPAPAPLPPPPPGR